MLRTKSTNFVLVRSPIIQLFFGVCFFVIWQLLLMNITGIYKHGPMYDWNDPPGIFSIALDTAVIFLKDSTGLSAFLLYWLLNIPINLFFTTFIVRRWVFIIYILLYFLCSIIFSPYEILGFGRVIPGNFSAEEELHYSTLLLSFLAIVSYLYNLFISNSEFAKKVGNACVLAVLMISLRYAIHFSFYNDFFYTYSRTISLLMSLMFIFFLIYRHSRSRHSRSGAVVSSFEI